MNHPSSSPASPAPDEHLLDELGAAVREAARVPESFLAAGRSAFAWRTVDAELATFAAAEPVAVRDAEAARLRSFTFAARELTIEVEVGDDALVGQVVPPSPGRIELCLRSGVAATADVDALGWFALRPLPTGLFRLHLHPANGSSVVSEWVSL